MTRRWAVCLERDEVDSLRTLRLVDNAEVCEQDRYIWVRGPTLDDALARLLRRHPHARRYWVLPDQQLLGPGKLVPQGYLPAGPWGPLREWLEVALPVANFAGAVTSRVEVRLVRTGVVRASNVMLTNIADWSAYGADAPQVRLDHWYFAAAGDGRVVVRGTPLPPLPGRHFVAEHGIGIPAGWKCDPDVPTEVLRAVFQVDQPDLVLLCEDDSHERIPGSCFVRASRSAIRMTAREYADA
jgi:hypothetical protein